MSEYNWQEESEFGDSDLVKRLRKEIEKRDSALKSRDEEFETLRVQVRRQSVSSILRDMGVKPKVANLVPADLEPTADAVKAWVAEYEDVFGSVREQTATQASTGEQEPSAKDDGPEPNGKPNIDSESQHAWARMQNSDASAGTTSPTGEDAQLQWLNDAAKAAEGDADKYFAILRGDVHI